MANTKITLEYPYKEDWKSGYVNINPDGRATLALYNSHNNRSSTQYARYLLAVHLKRYLNEDEHVDHIDGDKTNDDIDNLQILTLAENNRKTHKKPDVELVCPMCKKHFTRTRTQLTGKCKQEKVKNGTLCCSRSCGSKYFHKT